MRAKLRPVGNSVGLTIPASELRAVGAKAGDEVELEIKRVIRLSREDWNDPTSWPGAVDESPLMDDLPRNEFDVEDWEW